MLQNVVCNKILPHAYAADCNDFVGLYLQVKNVEETRKKDIFLGRPSNDTGRDQAGHFLH